MEHGSENGARTNAKVKVLASIEGEASVLASERTAEATLAEVVSDIARAHHRDDLTTLLISLEDTDEPVEPSTVVQKAFRGARRGRIHLHRCRRVAVRVTYNNTDVEHEFAPASTVHRVLIWAVGRDGFNVEGDVHDLELQLPGATEALAPSTHIGTLVTPGTCALALHLVPKDREQG